MRLIHGHAPRKGGKSPTYYSWANMLNRCHCGKFKAYIGVVACERWLSFENFLEDMGERPQGKTLNRIDTHGNYEPSNCNWATRFEQQANLKTNRLITFNGKTLHLRAWARELGMSYGTLHRRIEKMPLEKAMTLPLQMVGRRAENARKRSRLQR